LAENASLMVAQPHPDTLNTRKPETLPVDEPVTAS